MTVLLILALVSLAAALFIIGALGRIGAPRDEREQAADDDAQRRFLEEYERNRGR